MRKPYHLHYRARLRGNGLGPNDFIGTISGEEGVYVWDTVEKRWVKPDPNSPGEWIPEDD